MTGPLAICVLAYCLITEGHARQCVLDPGVKDAVVRVERPLEFPLLEGFGPGFTTVEHRACAAIAGTHTPPANYRLTEFFVTRKPGARTP
jgi:hypothetical protein